MVEELKRFLNSFNISYVQIKNKLYINSEDVLKCTNLLTITNNANFIYYALYYLKGLDNQYLIDKIIDLKSARYVYLCNKEFNYPSYDVVVSLSESELDPEVLYWRACEEENAPLDKIAKMLDYCSEIEWIYAFCVEYPEYLDYFFNKIIRSDDLEFLRNFQYTYRSRFNLEQAEVLNDRINAILSCREVEYSYRH